MLLWVGLIEHSVLQRHLYCPNILICVKPKAALCPLGTTGESQKGFKRGQGSDLLKIEIIINDILL